MREILAWIPTGSATASARSTIPICWPRSLSAGLVLDVCPTSNVRTGCVPSLADHPLPALRAAGVRCTINTDDPAMFGTDLSVEHEVRPGLGVSAATRSRPASPEHCATT
jgi:aminodeoxyfutalosine deaminase